MGWGMGEGGGARVAVGGGVTAAVGGGVTAVGGGARVAVGGAAGGGGADGGGAGSSAWASGVRRAEATSTVRRIDPDRARWACIEFDAFTEDLLLPCRRGRCSFP